MIISWIVPYRGANYEPLVGSSQKLQGFWITSLHDFSGYASVLVFRHVSSCNGTITLILFLLHKFASPLTRIRLLQTIEFLTLINNDRFCNKTRQDDRSGNVQKKCHSFWLSNETIFLEKQRRF